MDDAPADESPAHIFKDLPQVNMTVTQQHNGVDCGLYMSGHYYLVSKSVAGRPGTAASALASNESSISVATATVRRVHGRGACHVRCL